MRRVLFVCGKNRKRSPTAEAFYADRADLEVSSAGTAADAECPLSANLIEWAQIIVVMESRYARQMKERFGKFLNDRSVVNLDIPDRFEFMDSELLDLLRRREARWLTGE